MCTSTIRPCGEVDSCGDNQTALFIPLQCTSIPLQHAARVLGSEWRGLAPRHVEAWLLEATLVASCREGNTHGYSRVFMSVPCSIPGEVLPPNQHGFFQSHTSCTRLPNDLPTCQLCVLLCHVIHLIMLFIAITGVRAISVLSAIACVQNFLIIKMCASG